MKEVYINSVGKFLPGNAVFNDDMEKYLGFVGGNPSRYREIVLRANKIKSRYYARTPEGAQTHTNEELAELALRDAIRNHGEINLQDIQMLSFGRGCPKIR